MTKAVPLILNDGSNSYIYGPGGLPVEQVSSGGAVLYLHHDQQGSTRMLTSSAGKAEATTTFDPYGNQTGSTGTVTTPLGYDGQYTSSDTGFIYLRARVYDPATAQFMSPDALRSLTREPYTYAADNAVNFGDPTGYEALPVPIEGPAGLTLCADPVTAAICVAAGGYAGVEASKAIINAWFGEEGGDEGEAELHRMEAERGECTPDFGDPSQPPGPGWEWRGKGDPGSNEGSWISRDTGEKLHPDFDHPGHGPHYDYTAPDGSRYRLYPDGRIESK